jgi:hypothetical protein
MRGRRIVFGAILVAALGILAAFMLEGLVRIFQPQVLPQDVPDLWVKDAVIGWRHQPNQHVVANSGERDVDVCTNALGDRVACGVPARTDCAKRVLAIGDSFVEALAVPFDETVWSRLDSDTGACTDVAGVGAYYLSQYVAQTRERLRAPGAHYDLIVVSLYVGNDLTADPDKLPKPQEIERRPMHLFPAGFSEQDLWDWFYPYNSWLKGHSQAYVAVRFAIRRWMDPGDIGFYGVPEALRRSELTPALLDGTTRGLREIGEEAHRHGARCLVVVVPHRSQAIDPDGAVLLRGLPQLKGDVDMDLTSRELVPLIREAPEIDRVVDLLPPLRARADPELWGTRDTHLSPKGHEVWFEALRDPVRELLAAPPLPAGG